MLQDEKKIYKRSSSHISMNLAVLLDYFYAQKPLAHLIRLFQNFHFFY